MATRVGIEWRDPHQAMHARFGLQPAMGVVALDGDRRRLDPGLFARRLFDQVDRIAAPLGPAHIHAQEHARPVAALGAACAGMNFEIGVVGVGLAGEQGFDLPSFALDLQRLELIDPLLLGRRVALAFAKLDERDGVVELAFELGERLQAILENRSLAHQLLRGVRIVPERRSFGFGVQFGEAARRSIDVKDASSAVRRTA